MTTTTAPAIGARIDIRRAGPHDLADVAAVLATAFQDDPVFTWCIPDPARRRAALPAFFSLCGELVAVHDETYVAGVTTAPVAGSVDGAALWTPVGEPAVPDEAGERFGDAVAEVVGPDTGRVFELVALLDEHHPHEPHRFLWFLGVAPALQGRGIGGGLLRPVLAAADQAGEAAYLDATSDRNRRLYERHGFEVVRTLTTGGSPPMFSMWRAPRRA